MRRSLPDLAQAQAILAQRRTRPARRPPPPAGRTLAPILKTLGARFQLGPQVLTERWVEIAGEVLARRTEPSKLVRHRVGPATLEVRVDGPAAALLQHQTSELLARVNLVLGSDAVGRLRIVQGPVRPRGAKLDRSPAQPPPPPPLDAAAEEELIQSLDALADGPLKRSLLALGRAALRQGAR